MHYRCVCGVRVLGVKIVLNKAYLSSTWRVHCIDLDCGVLLRRNTEACENRGVHAGTMHQHKQAFH